MRETAMFFRQPLPYGRITYTGSKGQAYAFSAGNRPPQRRCPQRNSDIISPVNRLSTRPRADRPDRFPEPFFPDGKEKNRRPGNISIGSGKAAAGTDQKRQAREVRAVRRCVIIGAAEIGRYDRIRGRLRQDDWFVYCDGGLRHEQKLGRQPDLIVGDFDSHEKPDTETETIILPREKDDTDTVYAVKEAVRRGFSEFLLVGVIGERFDHTFGNICLLLRLDSLGAEACILDDYSEMSVVSRETAEVEDSFSYFSLLNISGIAKGIDIRDAKYPLDNGEISSEYQYGISNEVLPGRTARISVKEGRLLLVKVF